MGVRVGEDGEGVRTGAGAKTGAGVGMGAGGRVGIKGQWTDQVRRVGVVRLNLFFILTNIKMYLKTKQQKLLELFIFEHYS